MSLRLIVKGSARQAMRAAERRRIVATVAKELRCAEHGAVETHLRIDPQSEERAERWFDEYDDRFPVGMVLAMERRRT